MRREKICRIFNFFRLEESSLFYRSGDFCVRGFKLTFFLNIFRESNMFSPFPLWRLAVSVLRTTAHPFVFLSRGRKKGKVREMESLFPSPISSFKSPTRNTVKSKSLSRQRNTSEIQLCSKHNEERFFSRNLEKVKLGKRRCL